MATVLYEGLTNSLREERRAETVHLHISHAHPRTLRDLCAVPYSIEVQWFRSTHLYDETKADLPFEVYYNIRDRTFSGEKIVFLPETEDDSFLVFPLENIIQPQKRIETLEQYGTLVAQYCAQRGLLAHLRLTLDPRTDQSEFRSFSPRDADYTFPHILPLLTPTGIVIPTEGEFLTNN